MPSEKVAAQAITPSLQFELEDMYRKGFPVEAMMKFSQSKEIDLNAFGWLVQKAMSGVPPFQYELGRQFYQRNSPGALEWYAKGYVVRSLDFAECANKTRSATNFAITNFYAPLQDWAIKEPVAYADALTKAIQWEQTRAIRPASEWVCDGASLPPEERAAARAKQTEEIRAGIERLRLKGAGQ